MASINISLPFAKFLVTFLAMSYFAVVWGHDGSFFRSEFLYPDSDCGHQVDLNDPLSRVAVTLKRISCKGCPSGQDCLVSVKECDIYLQVTSQLLMQTHYLCINMSQLHILNCPSKIDLLEGSRGSNFKIVQSKLCDNSLDHDDWTMCSSYWFSGSMVLSYHSSDFCDIQGQALVTFKLKENIRYFDLRQKPCKSLPTTADSGYVVTRVDSSDRFWKQDKFCSVFLQPSFKRSEGEKFCLYFLLVTDSFHGAAFVLTDQIGKSVILNYTGTASRWCWTFTTFVSVRLDLRNFTDHTMNKNHIDVGFTYEFVRSESRGQKRNEMATETGSGLSIGGIIGISLLGVIFLICVCAVWLQCDWRKNQRPRSYEIERQDEEATEMNSAEAATQCAPLPPDEDPMLNTSNSNNFQTPSAPPNEEDNTEPVVTHAIDTLPPTMPPPDYSTLFPDKV